MYEIIQKHFSGQGGEVLTHHVLLDEQGREAWDFGLDLDNEAEMFASALNNGELTVDEFVQQMQDRCIEYKFDVKPKIHRYTLK